MEAIDVMETDSFNTVDLNAKIIQLLVLTIGFL